MAFKLTGDRYKEIHLLQKRRVEELLASNIPEDEALLMKNGRFTCLVCKHKPTFDTVAMLSLHRSGQKHIRAAHTLLQQRQCDQEELEKREQLQVGRKHNEEDIVPLLAKTQAATKHAILSSAPYCSHSGKACRDMEGGGKPQETFFTRKRCWDETSKEQIDGASTSKKSCTDTSGKVTINEDKTPEKPSLKYVFPWNISTSKKKIKSEKRHSEESLKEVIDSTGARKSQIYMQRKSAGWLYNPSGTWYKDPTVEFDSDEDAPSRL